MQVPDLYAALDRLLNQIPPGRVATYGGLARALGDVAAARWIATYLLHEHAHHAECACHRVVRIGGDIGSYYSGNPDDKARALRREGISIHSGCADFDRFGFDTFETDFPLALLRDSQQTVAQKVGGPPLMTVPRVVGGVDAAYLSPTEAVAAYALCDVATGELVWSMTRRQAIRFPYIQNYLSFRELPALLPLIDEVRAAGHLADVVLVDGNGRLHQRQAGIATHLGVAADIRTVGVAKKLLCGDVDLAGLSAAEARPILLNGVEIAAAMRAAARSNPIFISPGYRIDLNLAATIVRQCFHGHRLPEPVHWAHTLANGAARPV